MAAGELLVVAIDIGTTYSGYAMSFADDKYTIHAILGSGNRNPTRVSACPTPNKVPTALLLKPDGSFHSFGHEALNHYNIEIEEEEQKHWIYFSRFKMKLHHTAVRKPLVQNKRLQSFVYFDRIFLVQQWLLLSTERSFL